MGVTVPLSVEQTDRLHEAAAGAGLTVAEYVRRLIITAITPAPAPPTEHDIAFRQALDATMTEHAETLRRLAMGPGDPRLNSDN